jgi:hypothetical protein
MGDTAAIAGGGALLGAISGSKSKGGGTSTQTKSPWAEQSPYLKEAFGEAQSIYQDQKGTPWYQGPTYAGLNGVQQGAIQGTQGWTGGVGNQLVNGAAGAALGSMGNIQAAGSNAQGFASGNYGVTSGASPLVTQMMNHTALGGMGQMGSAVGATNNALGMASGNPTQGNIQAAGQYASNPYLQSQIDAVGNDATTALGRNLVGLNNSASMGGNLNSSRAGAAEAVMRQGTADQIARTSADMRSAAYQSGLGLAESARGTNLQGTLAAGSQFGGLAGQGLSAGSTTMNFGEGQRQFDTQARLDGNEQLLRSGSLGLDAAQVGNGMALGNQNANLSAGGVLQADQQGQYDVAFQQWQGNDTRANDLLARYYSVIGGKDWGESTTTTAPKTGGGFMDALQSAIGGATAGMGLYGDYQKSQGLTNTTPTYTNNYGTVGGGAINGPGKTNLGVGIELTPRTLLA